MTDIKHIERALTERLEEVEARLRALADLERERDCLRRALHALCDEDDAAGEVACPARAEVAGPHAPPWRRDRVRR